MKKGTIILGLSAFTATALVITITSAFTFVGSYRDNPPGAVAACPGANSADIGDFTVNGVCVTTQQTLANSPDGETPAWTQFQVSGFTNTQEHPELGTLTYSVDPSRPLTSEIRANQESDEFPATATLHWHATLVDGSGVEYRSINPVTMQAIITFWPNNNTTYTQIGTTDFERVSEPGEVALTVSNARATVTQG